MAKQRKEQAKIWWTKTNADAIHFVCCSSQPNGRDAHAQHCESRVNFSSLRISNNIYSFLFISSAAGLFPSFPCPLPPSVENRPHHLDGGFANDVPFVMVRTLNKTLWFNIYPLKFPRIIEIFMHHTSRSVQREGNLWTTNASPMDDERQHWDGRHGTHTKSIFIRSKPYRWSWRIDHRNCVRSTHCASKCRTGWGMCDQMCLLNVH